jgi:hypothetical protein
MIKERALFFLPAHRQISGQFHKKLRNLKVSLITKGMQILAGQHESDALLNLICIWTSLV